LAKWNWRRLLLFEAVVCIVTLLFSIASSVAPRIVLTVPARGGLSLGSDTVLFLLGSFVPGIVLLLMSRECRSATLRLQASFGVYASAIGFFLPFSSYLGAGVSYPPWNSSTLTILVRVFAINLPLSPLWEEIIWRAYFFPKVNSMMGRGPSIVVAALGSTLWYVGFLFQLHHSGIRAALIAILVVRLFLGGVVSLFTLRARP
jgi:membrane protease YdiL (CAAX protease family)